MQSKYQIKKKKTFCVMNSAEEFNCCIWYLSKCVEGVLWTNGRHIRDRLHNVMPQNKFISSIK